MKMAPGLGDIVSGGAYRDGNLLLVTTYGTLPPVCVRCGSPVARKPFHKKYSWHPFFIYLFFPVKFLVPMGDKLYDLMCLAGEELELDVYICPKHRANEILIALAQLLVATIGLFVCILNLGAGLLLILASNVGASMLPPRLRPTFIDESHGTFKGAGAAFLDQLTAKPPGVAINTLGIK